MDNVIYTIDDLNEEPKMSLTSIEDKNSPTKFISNLKEKEDTPSNDMESPNSDGEIKLNEDVQ